MKKFLMLVVALLLAALLFAGCSSQSEKPGTTTPETEPIKLRISAGLARVHFWVGNYLDPFADKIEAETNGQVTFERFYAGELVKVGRELDSLGTTIDVAAPFLAPYHEGLFPLSDITHLPTIETNSVMVTEAFQKLVDSDVVLKDGKTFYQYEFDGKDMMAWPMGVTGGYVFSTVDKQFPTPESFSGVPLRAGSAVHMMFLESVGCTPVYMPAAEAYEALSRKTIDGIILSVGDWKSYGLQDVLRYSITGVNIGHWDSYLAMKKSTWDTLTPEVQELWDKTARELALENAAYIDNRDAEEMQSAKEQQNAVFQDVSELDPAVQEHISKAATETWKKWIEDLEGKGHPARATAKLWVELLKAEGGQVPEGVDALLQ